MASSLLIWILSTIVISNVASIQYGLQANVGDYKFAASIYSGGVFHCSGTIINDRYILTAGHCICGPGHVSLRVIVGVVRVTDARNVVWLETLLPRCYDSFRQFPGTRIYEHDIGLLKLKNRLVLGNNIESIALTITDGPFLQTGCKLVLFRENIKYNDNSQTNIYAMDLSLRWSSVVIPTPADCLPYNIPLVNEICAINDNQSEEFTRTGDSGAPVVCNGQVFGILVGSMGSTSMKGATVLKVAPYLRWIAHIVAPIE